MIILTIRTDKPEAEIGIFKDEAELGYERWLAHRQLAETIHHKIEQQLFALGLTLNNLGSVVVFTGPGSFTGLRIGLSIGNALAYGLKIPIVGTNGTSWRQAGIKKLLAGENQEIILPEYGSPAHITQQKK